MRILIVKCSALGDIIHVYPVVALIRKKYPFAKIDWAVEKRCLELVDPHPEIDRTVVIDTKNWRKFSKLRQTSREFLTFYRDLIKVQYDVVFDLQGNTKSSFVTALAKGTKKVGFAFANLSEWPNVLVTNRRFLLPKGLSVRDEYLHLAKAYFKDFSPFEPDGVVLKISSEQQQQVQKLVEFYRSFALPLVMICPGSQWQNKQLSNEGLKEFLSLFTAYRRSFFLFLWGNDKEREVADEMHKNFELSALVDRLSLPQLQNLMSHVDLVIGMDSLPLHLAATTQTPTFSLFGASSAQKYRPMGALHSSLQGCCPYGVVFDRRCPRLRTCNTGACIRSLGGSEIFSAYLAHQSSNRRF